MIIIRRHTGTALILCHLSPAPLITYSFLPSETRHHNSVLAAVYTHTIRRTEGRQRSLRKERKKNGRRRRWWCEMSPRSVTKIVAVCRFRHPSLQRWSFSPVSRTAEITQRREKINTVSLSTLLLQCLVCLVSVRHVVSVFFWKREWQAYVTLNDCFGCNSVWAVIDLCIPHLLHFLYLMEKITQRRNPWVWPCLFSYIQQADLNFCPSNWSE